MQHAHPHPDTETPDYDLHIPRPLTYPRLVSILSILVVCLLLFFLHPYPVTAGILAALCILIGGAYVAFFFLLKRFTNIDRRLAARDRFLDAIPWRGDEDLLDVGCGNGILVIGAAKRLTTGKAIGIDIWTENSGESRPEAFLQNARLEGVADRVSLHNEDVRRLPYPDASFDTIITGLTMHHISHGKDTAKAMDEMRRVLKPGGWIGIFDNPLTVTACAKLMLKHGLVVERKDRDMVFGTKNHSGALE
ncbi:MAG: class I SAM-dependent methyltransferase [Proteobacteria bacterium]|nr:class I SAM-dependent methyltransferase [Pseudomonadota bacterium]